MFAKIFTTTSLIAALALVPAQEAEADAAEFIGGAIIGGVIGHAIGSGATRTTRGTTTTTRTVRPGIPATQQGRETQTALNYFGFDAGAVDGQIGGGTRAAIERYQGTMGFPVNGREFSSYQFDFLMDAYYWATTGGAGQTGLRNAALLYAYRDNVQNGGSIQAAAPATTVIVAPQPQGTTVAATAPQPQGLPNLFANSTPTASLANTCNGVMLQTSTNGGYVTMASMTDPDFTLSEQFCVARTYAMAQGEQLMQSIVGLTQAQIAEQCTSFSAMLSNEIDRASLVGETELVPEMRSFALGTGIAPADLVSTSRVCLSVGYAQDDMRMAVGSALMLVAMGEPAYGEIMGHHLRQGFGTTTRPDLAMGWYDASLKALEEGTAQPSFMPGQPERVQLLRAAVTQLDTGLPAAIPASQTAPGRSNTLPTFTVSQ